MEWIIPLTAFVVGLVLGYMINNLLARKGQTKETALRAEQAEIELSQYKQNVEDFYMEQGLALAAMTEQLNQANRHWNEATAHLHFTQKSAELPTLAANTISDAPLLLESDADKADKDVRESDADKNNATEKEMSDEAQLETIDHAQPSVETVVPEDKPSQPDAKAEDTAEKSVEKIA